MQVLNNAITAQPPTTDHFKTQCTELKLLSQFTETKVRIRFQSNS